MQEKFFFRNRATGRGGPDAGQCGGCSGIGARGSLPYGREWAVLGPHEGDGAAVSQGRAGLRAHRGGAPPLPPVDLLWSYTAAVGACAAFIPPPPAAAATERVPWWAGEEAQPAAWAAALGRFLTTTTTRLLPTRPGSRPSSAR